MTTLPARIRGELIAAFLRLTWRQFGSVIGQATPADAYPWVQKGYDKEDSARAAIPRVLGHTQLSYERLVTLYEQVAHLERNNIEGCLVECGVWRGGAAGMMAIANLDTSEKRRDMHLFDSFQGMPEPLVEKDGADALDWAGRVGDGSLVSTGVNVADLETVRRLLVDDIGYPAASLFIHPGWFQHTLPSVAPDLGPIALLRVDGDWYDSTRVVFECLYDQVVSGGLVVIDDYGHFSGCRKATDEFMTAKGITSYLHYVDYTGRYFCKP